MSYEAPVVTVEAQENARIRKVLIALVEKAGRGRITRNKLLALNAALREYQNFNRCQYFSEDVLKNHQDNPPYSV